MVSESHKLDAILGRLDKVERENRILKRFALVVLLLITAAVGMGQAPTGRTLEAERFVLKDQAGRMRAEIIMDASGTPSLDFFDEKGKAGTRFRNGELSFFSATSNKQASMGESGLSISTEDGHIELGTEGLRLKVVSNVRDGLGWISLGMWPSALARKGDKGVIGPALTLTGNNGDGFIELAAADGPGLHLEPGSRQGRVFSGGIVDISSSGPLIQIADQDGLTAGIGRFELKDAQTGHLVKTPTASIVLTGKDGVLWSAP
jgi:hypothetical protein